MFALVTIGSALGNLSQTGLNAMLPSTMIEFGVEVDVGQWFTTGYMLVLGVAVPIATFLMQKLNDRQYMLLGFGLFAAGSLLDFVAPEFFSMLLGRILQAVSVGLLIPKNQTICMTKFPPGKQATAMGIAGIALFGYILIMSQSRMTLRSLQDEMKENSSYICDTFNFFKNRGKALQIWSDELYKDSFLVMKMALEDDPGLASSEDFLKEMTSLMGVQDIMFVDRNGKVTSYRQQADDFHGQQIVMATDAKNAYNDFMSRGNGVAGLLDHLHALPQAFDNYLSRSRSMYEMTQSEYAMTAIANVLEELALDIRTQMVDKTIPYAKAALKQIGEQVADDVKNSTIENGAMHMIDLEGMRRDIQTTYEKEETRQAFIERVMTLTADVVLSTVDAQDEDSAMSYVISSLNGMIDNIFLAINDTTLASMLQGFGGINANGVADYIKQEIAPRLERGASAHFALTIRISHGRERLIPPYRRCRAARFRSRLSNRQKA